MGIKAEVGTLRMIKGIEFECVYYHDHGRKFWMVSHTNNRGIVDALSSRYSLDMPKFDSIKAAEERIKATWD